MIKNRTVHLWMLEYATFAIASEHSKFDIWVLADGFSHGLSADDAIQMSISGGKGPDRLREWIITKWFPNELAEKPDNKSEFKIGMGIGFSPVLLKDAEFSRAKTKGIYCYITTPDGVKHMFTRYQTLRLSGRGGKYVDRLRAFLKDQGGWNNVIWEETECEITWPTEEDIQRGLKVIRKIWNEMGTKPLEG